MEIANCICGISGVLPFNHIFVCLCYNKYLWSQSYGSENTGTRDVAPTHKRAGDQMEIRDPG